jgi:hypothetical protein
MFTVFVETAQSDSDWKVLQAHAALVLDLRNQPSAPKGETLVGRAPSQPDRRGGQAASDGNR